MRHRFATLFYSMATSLGVPSLAAQSAGSERVPATNANILTEMKQGESGEGDVIYVENRSTENIIVTSIRFSDCENIKPGCHIVSLKARVKAGDKRMVYRVQPLNPDQPYSFRYSFAWKPEEAAGSAATPSPAAGGEQPSTAIVPFVEEAQLIEPDGFRPAVAAIDSGGVCEKLGDIGQPETAAAYLMTFGPADSPKRLVVLQVDSAGHPTQYSDGRGDFSAPGSLPTGLRTSIVINLVQEIGSLSNEGGNRRPERFVIRGPAMLTAASLGQPGKLIERMLRECRAQH